MTENGDWKKTWQDVELSEDELEDIRWGLLSTEVSGGKMSLEDAIVLRKRMIASGYLEKYRNFIKSYKDKYGDVPPRKVFEKWHDENPVHSLIDF